MENKEMALYVWLFMIIIGSFVGYMVENLWLIFRYGFIDNRNMNLPFLLGYGLAMFAFYIILGLPKESPDIRYFLGTFILVSLGEILLGVTVEKLCGIYYWDYSALPLHITRYTSVFTSAGFSLIVTNFMRSVFPAMREFAMTVMGSDLMRAVLAFGMIMLVADFIASFRYMYLHRSRFEKWKCEFDPENKIGFGR